MLSGCWLPCHAGSHQQDSLCRLVVGYHVMLVVINQMADGRIGVKYAVQEAALGNNSCEVVERIKPRSELDFMTRER